MADKPEKPVEKKVDEGWKEKAREEKEALSREAAGAKDLGQGKADAARDGSAGEPAEKEGAGEAPLQDVTFAGFVSGLATQAFISLGLIENPLTGKKEKNLDVCKHLLDTMDMLQEKTSGNLTDKEAAYMEELLYNLRLGYVREAKE